MANFAKVLNGKVTKVIVAEPEFFNTFIDNEPGDWIQTSYNTKGGVHLLGGTPLRKNYAGIGMIYDRDRDAFYWPQPYASWSLNEDTCQWQSPVPMPEDAGTDEPPKLYAWDEDTTSWVDVTPSE